MIVGMFDKYLSVFCDEGEGGKDHGKAKGDNEKAGVEVAFYDDAEKYCRDSKTDHKSC